MVPDRMQSQRFEHKYVIPEEKALMVRDFVQSYLDLDEYGAGRPNLSYEVHSLYLDSDTLKTYWDTINGNRNRFKLRLRFYNANPGVPVYFEIKRRTNNCIRKQRGAVKPEAVTELLNGFLPGPEHLAVDTAKALVAVQGFSALMQQIEARPKVHIAYDREAYANETGSVRVTLDRHVRAVPSLDHRIRTEMIEPRYSFHPLVILELKFTDRFPNWFGDLVRRFSLNQRGAAKYCASVQAICRFRGHQALRTVFPVVPEEEVPEDVDGD